MVKIVVAHAKNFANFKNENGIITIRESIYIRGKTLILSLYYSFFFISHLFSITNIIFFPYLIISLLNIDRGKKNQT